MAAYFASSDGKNCAACSGVLTLIVLPCFAIASRTSGVAKAAANAALMRLTSAGGNRAGPMTANHPTPRPRWTLSANCNLPAGRMRERIGRRAAALFQIT